MGAVPQEPHNKRRLVKISEGPGTPPAPVDPLNFTGNATLSRMDGICDRPYINLYRVTFQPKARTAWHFHSGPQLLIVIEGLCLLQKEGEPIQELQAGGTASIASGEKHWHGASPGSPMTHLALNIDANTTWLSKVTESEYYGSN